MPSESNNDSDRISIGRIPLKQVRVKRSEPESAKASNPMNRLVPYLDLFCRLDDEELATLTSVDLEVVATLRKQVVTIDRGLEHYVDLLPRLRDEELVRLTGASLKTIRFWRLCQPRVPVTKAPAQPSVPERAAAQPVANDVREAERSASGDRPSTDSPQHVARFMNFSGDPFPGYDGDDAAIPTPPPTSVDTRHFETE